MKGLVILPTYNEIDNIEKITSMILAVDRSLDILIVDDNSPDGTGRLADRLAAENSRISVLCRENKQGLGSAYIAGFRYALARGYSIVFEMDADMSHDPAYLAEFLDKIKMYDLVIGSRYIKKGGVENWPWHRFLLSYFANIYARIITGVPVQDLTGGFKCFRRQVLETVDLDRVFSEGYAFQIEVTYRCWKKGFAIREIPITFYDRLQGTTKISRKIIWEAVWVVWKLKFLALTGRL